MREPSDKFFFPIIETGIKNLYDSHLAKTEERTIIKTYPLYVRVEKIHKNANAVGFAFPIFWKEKEEKQKYNLFKTDKRVSIDKKSAYPLIIVDDSYFFLQSYNNIKNTVFHEIAHCVDFYFRGFEGRTNKGFHDSEFFRIFNAVKGNVNFRWDY